MRYLLLPALCLAAALSFSTARAVDDSGNAKSETVQLANGLLDSLSLREALPAWRRILLAQQSFPSCGDEDKDARIATAWSTAVTSVLGDQIPLDAVQRRIAATFSVDELRELQKFNDSELGRKNLASVRKALASEPPGDLQAELAEMADRTRRLDADPERKQALKRLVDVTRGEETQVELFMNIQIGLALGMAAASPEAQPRLDLHDIREMAEASRPLLKSMVAAILLPGLESMYEPLTTSELNEYSTYLESSLGRKLVAFAAALGTEFMRDAVMAIGAEFSRQIGRIEL